MTLILATSQHWRQACNWQLGLPGSSGRTALGPAEYRLLWRRPWPCHNFWRIRRWHKRVFAPHVPMSQGLFHGAIMESGVALLPGLTANSSDKVSKVSALTHGKPRPAPRIS